MATIKAYTDLEQSKRLVGILPPESADMWYQYIGASHEVSSEKPLYYPMVIRDCETDKDIPCWSLAALLNVLDFPSLLEDKLGSGKTGWMVSIYPNGCRYDSNWYDNPVDACVEMILYSKKRICYECRSR